MIAPLSPEHVDAVASMHTVNLTGLLSQLGLAAARVYYAGCTRSPSAVGFVYHDAGIVRGFVLGSADPVLLKRDVVRANRVATIAGVLRGVVRRPRLLESVLKSFRGPDEGRYDARAPELIYLAVDPSARTSGVGTGLVDAFGDAMRRAGIHAYELSVDDDNLAAIGFYEKLGFRVTGRYREFGILHRRYGMDL